MKAETAWNVLKQTLRDRGSDFVDLMNQIEAEPEPQFVYRLFYPKLKGNRPVVGTSFRMKCIVNQRRQYPGFNSDNVKIERSPLGKWADVTEDFLK